MRGNQTFDLRTGMEDLAPENVLTLQDYAGHDAMMQAILEMADNKLQKVEQRRRRAFQRGDRSAGRRPPAGRPLCGRGHPGRPGQHCGKGYGFHCQVRHQPHCGGALPGGKAHQTRPDLCRIRSGMARSMAHSLFTTNFSLPMSSVWMTSPSGRTSRWMRCSTWR